MWILEVKSSSPPPFPSLLYLSTFHRFSTFPFPLFPFPSYPTLGTFLLSSSYLTILLPFPVPSVVPYIPLSLSTFLLPSQPSFTFFHGYPSPFPFIFHLPFFSFFSHFHSPFLFPFPGGEERILYTPVG